MSKWLLRLSLIFGLAMMASGIVGACMQAGCSYQVDVPRPVVNVGCIELVFGTSHAVECPPADAGDGGG